MPYTICQGCMASWSSATDFSQHTFHFEDSLLVTCPRCPRLSDRAAGAPVSELRGLQEGRAPDSGERSPGKEDADAVHPPEES